MNTTKNTDPFAYRPSCACDGAHDHDAEPDDPVGLSGAAQHKHAGCCAKESSGFLGKRISLYLQSHAEELTVGGSAVLFVATLLLEPWMRSAYGPWLANASYAIPYLLCGWSVFVEGIRLIGEKFFFNEFTLMGGATLAAIFLGEMPEAVGVMLFYRVGEYLQHRAASHSHRSIVNLLAAKPKTARLVLDGQYHEVPVEQVEAGQLFLVRPGEMIPLDGTVREGASSVDQSPLTGESFPVRVEEKNQVFGGSINKEGVLVVEANAVFAQSHMARILDLVAHAAQSKSPTERFISRIARYYTPAVVLLALLVWLLPPLVWDGQTFGDWGYRALVLLVISCPCALIISIPLGYFGGIGAASRRGILIKSGEVLDALLQVKRVVFDKTGTLTAGEFRVEGVFPAQGSGPEQLLAVAYALERFSSHPVAQSVVAYVDGLEQAPDTGVPSASDVRETPGKGVEGRIDGVPVLAGSAVFLMEHGVSVPDTGPQGRLHVARDGGYLGVIVLADSLKVDAVEAIRALHREGKETYVFSGDKQASVEQAAAELGVTGFKAELLPEDKVRAMQSLGDTGETAFVGDGLNDAPALALSGVGIAMGGVGAEAAIEAADAVIVNDSPEKTADLFRIARKVRVIVWENIGFALTIKFLFIVLGVLGQSGLWEAVFADVGVALLAVLNASRAGRV